MGGLSIWHILVVGILVVLLFGRGKISELMGDVAKGIKSFRKGMSEDDQPPEKPKSIPDATREQSPAPKADERTNA
jgi:sec-independent protein translocase protein TatA